MGSSERRRIRRTFKNHRVLPTQRKRDKQKKSREAWHVHMWAVSHRFFAYFNCTISTQFTYCICARHRKHMRQTSAQCRSPMLLFFLLWIFLPMQYTASMRWLLLSCSYVPHVQSWLLCCFRFQAYPRMYIPGLLYSSVGAWLKHTGQQMVGRTVWRNSFTEKHRLHPFHASSYISNFMFMAIF